MKASQWVTDPLAFLIDPISPDTFFSDYHENKALHCCHNDSSRYSELLSIARIDELIADSELPPASLQMARSEPAITRDQFTYPNGNIDRGAVIRHYQQGATVILPQMHLADARLADFCLALESLFSVQVQTNVYLTPPNSQGFRTHYDDHDVFVIQVSGEKYWQLYYSPVENPYRGEGFKPGEYDVGKPVDEFILKAGDCVYVPRGMMHDAATSGDEPSLHITVGLIARTWADLMLEAMSSVALKHPEFRKALPAGFAKEDFNNEEANEYFATLVNRFSKQADFQEALELFVDNFVRRQEPVVREGLVQATRPINDNDRFCKRLNIQTRINVRADDFELVCPGGSLFFKLHLLDDVKLCISSKEFGIRKFTCPDDDRKDLIRKLQAFGVIVKV